MRARFQTDYSDYKRKKRKYSKNRNPNFEKLTDKDRKYKIVLSTVQSTIYRLYEVYIFFIETVCSGLELFFHSTLRTRSREENHA